MSNGLIGKKLGMTSIFLPDGRHVPVTVIQVGPCTVTQVKSIGTDGYDALQLGYGNKKEKLVNRPLQGHMKKAGGKLFSVLREFSVENPDDYEAGQELLVDMFKIGELVDVTGTTKGRGFSGVIKRHGFHGGRMTHGSKSKRVPGSIGCSAWPSKVIKGKKMPGQFGVERKTVKNMEVVDVRVDDNLMMVKGPVPGPPKGTVLINKVKGL